MPTRTATSRGWRTTSVRTTLDFAYATATAGYLDPALNGVSSPTYPCVCRLVRVESLRLTVAAGLFTCSGTPEGEPVCSADYQDLTNNGCSPSNTGSSDTLGAVTCGETHLWYDW